MTAGSPLAALSLSADHSGACGCSGCACGCPGVLSRQCPGRRPASRGGTDEPRAILGPDQRRCVMRLVAERSRRPQRAGPQVVAPKGEVERLGVGALGALRRELLASVGERALDLLRRRSILALGPGDADCHAGCRAWVGARVVPPAPALPHPRMHGLVAGEAAEHVEQGIDNRDVSAIGLQAIVGRYGHDGVRRVAERHGVPDASSERRKPVRDPATGGGSVVPRGVDGDEVRRDNGDHASTVSTQATEKLVRRQPDSRRDDSARGPTLNLARASHPRPRKETSFAAHDDHVGPASLCLVSDRAGHGSPVDDPELGTSTRPNGHLGAAQLGSSKLSQHPVPVHRPRVAATTVRRLRNRNRDHGQSGAGLRR